MSIDDGLRKIFHDHLVDAHWQSVETGGTGKGIPDSNYCFPGGLEGWVEYKATEAWSVAGVVKPEQVAWIERRLRMGGRVHVAVRRHCLRGPRREAADELWLFAGSAIRDLKYRPINEVGPALLLYKGNKGPASWDWGMVQEVLTARSGC